MGKNLKGKEIGKGISQRKDGAYCARFVNKRGKRQEDAFQLFIGGMAKSSVKPMYCEMVLNLMKDDYAGSTKAKEM